jgi:hypothetical protein
MGIPVIVCRHDHDVRFSLLAGMMPIYTPDTMHTIDWNPAPVDVTDQRRRFIDTVADLLAHAG